MRNRRSQGLVEYVGILIAIGLAVAGLMGVVTTQLGAKMNSLDLAGGGGGGGGGGGPVTYTITAQANGGSSAITPSGSVSVTAGDSLMLTLTCDGATDVVWNIDGVPQANVMGSTNYTFTNVSANHTITITACAPNL